MKEKITSPQEIIKSQLKSQKISKEYFGSYFGWDKKELKKFFKYKDKLDEETINKLTLFFKSPDDFWKNINDNYKTKLRKQSENLLDNLDKKYNYDLFTIMLIPISMIAIFITCFVYSFGLIYLILFFSFVMATIICYLFILNDRLYYFHFYRKENSSNIQSIDKNVQYMNEKSRIMQNEIENNNKMIHILQEEIERLQRIQK